ncbi:MAG: type VI secretion system accessory protein TagJ [Pyrinomonadaceae bacterium]
MSVGKKLFEAGKLQEAIDQITNEVRADPADGSRRTFLFELLCFAGEWQRAEKQLDVLAHQSTAAELGVMIYRANIKAEQERRRLFTEGVQPHFLKEPPTYIDLNLAALNHVRKGEWAEARATLDQAEEARPAFSGKLNGEEFSDIRDNDDFVAPVLELIVKDKYVWMPIEQIKSLQISPPGKLRDLLWASARVEALDGTIGEVYMPSLYEGTSEHPDDQTKLGRLTDWQDLGGEVYRSVGLRMFRVDDQDKTLFEIESIQFAEQKSN